jgi:predicted phage tail protein
MTVKKQKLVRGAGGGGGKGGGGGAAAVEATDSLHSKQFARVVDLISEGPIVGLVDGVNSVYLNETPLATNGVFNFKDVGLNWTTGTQTQLTKGALAAGAFGFDDVRYPNQVNVIVPSASPVVRTLSNANVNTIVVTVSVPSLLSRDASNGNTNPSKIDLAIDLQSAAAGFVRKVTDTINGKTTSKYQRSYSIDVSGPGPWDIRVTKVTTDSTSQLLENQLYFDDFTGVISTQLTYPNSAVIAASIDSQQFQAIPTRGYDIKGLLVKIPSNYNPVTRAYSGTWDGTFVVAWTDNPAWCYYDMLTNSRYGLGDFIDPTQVDKWALYTIAQYCDVLVPSGVGTATEPRFTCNLYLQSPAEAYKVIQNMASIFRAITFWSTGSITVVQDSPQNPIALFSNANVIDGAFTYAGSSIKARHTVAQISWNDPADFYRQKIEYVQDDDGVKTYGVMRADIVAFGCTSRGQANRLGKWLLYSEKAETETVTFRAGLDGFQLYPGAIIKTSDANRAGQRMGGRIVSATTTSATLDAPVTIVAGKTYTLSIIQPDGSVVKTAASAATGQRTVLSLATLPQAPQVNSMFVFEANDLVAETWRIIGVSQPEHHLVEVSAVKHDPTKFAQIELGQKFDAPITTSILVRPDVPTNLSVLTSPYTIGGAVVGLRATFSWSSREGIFKVRWRQAGGIWQERRVTESTIDIDNIDYTAYEFQVYAINQIGRESDVATLNQSITVPPVVLPALTGLMLDGAFTAKLARIKWDACPGATSYRVEVRDTASNTTRRIVNVGNALRFDYSSSDMRADGGPWRALTFYVTPLGQFGSASAAAGSLAVTNPQVGAINGVALTGGIKTVYLSYSTPADSDYVGVQVWLSTDSACPAVAGNLVYDGNDSLLVFRTLGDKVTALAGGTNYYVRIAGYDDFGKDGMTISGSLLVVPVASAPDLNSITADMLKAGILDNTKFASSIAPVGLVAALPTVAGYAGPVVVYNTADGKLYRLVAGAWTAAVAGADIVANSITGGQMAVGAVTAREIAAGAITTDKIAIGDMSNQCSNPNFEFGDIGWIKEAGWSIVGPSASAFSGNWYASKGPSSSSSALRNGQYIDVQTGDVFYARATIQNGAAADLACVRVTGINKSLVESVLGQGAYIFRSAWTEDSCTVTVPAGIIRIRVEVVSATAAGGYCWADNVGMFRMSGATLIQDGAITTNKMTAASINGDRITANTLNADRIIANSITVDKIKAGGISANVFSSGVGSGNLLLNSSFADAVGTTPLNWSVAADSNSCVFGNNLAGNPWTIPGYISYTIVQPQANNAVAYGPNYFSSYYTEIMSDPVPVVAGQYYEGSVYNGSHRCASVISIYFYDSSGAAISSAYGQDNVAQYSGGMSLSGYKRLFTLALAPSNASTARLLVRKSSTFTGETSSYSFNTLPLLCLANGANQSFPSPYSPSGIGTQISGGLIRAQTITATQIAASTITADKLSVTSLSAITATIGTLRTAASGQRTEIADNVIRVYDAANVLRVKLGDLS